MYKILSQSWIKVTQINDRISMKNLGMDSYISWIVCTGLQNTDIFEYAKPTGYNFFGDFN